LIKGRIVKELNTPQILDIRCPQGTIEVKRQYSIIILEKVNVTGTMAEPGSS